jgi:CspA family cold shock protein
MSTQTGRVKWFNAKDGFGFIKADVGGDVFVHKSVVQGQRMPTEGDLVQFESASGPKGLRATTLRVLTGAGEPVKHLRD